MVRAHTRTSKQKGIWKKESVELRLVRRCKVCVVLMVRAPKFEPSMLLLTSMFFRWMHHWIPLNPLAFLYWPS